MRIFPAQQGFKTRFNTSSLLIQFFFIPTEFYIPAGESERTRRWRSRRRRSMMLTWEPPGGVEARSSVGETWAERLVFPEESKIKRVWYQKHIAEEHLDDGNCIKKFKSFLDIWNIGKKIQASYKLLIGSTNKSNPPTSESTVEPQKCVLYDSLLIAQNFFHITFIKSTLLYTHVCFLKIS